MSMIQLVKQIKAENEKSKYTIPSMIELIREITLKNNQDQDVKVLKQLFLIDLENFEVPIRKSGFSNYYNVRSYLLKNFLQPLFFKSEYLICWFGRENLASANKMNDIDSKHELWFPITEKKGNLYISADLKMTLIAGEYINHRYAKRISKVYIGSGDLHMIHIVNICDERLIPVEFLVYNQKQLSTKFANYKKHYLRDE